MNRKVNVKKITVSDVIYNIVSKIIVFGFTLMCFYPFYYVIIYSVSDPTLAIKNGVRLWPQGLSFTTYKELLMDETLWRAYFISGARTVIGTFLSVLCTSMLAFLMTRKELPWRKIFYRYFIITMYVSAGLVPWYLVMKAYGLRNNFLLYVVPCIFSAYNMILVKTFIEQLPEALEEAAVIEGAGVRTLFFRIVLPLCKPIVATIAVFTAVGQWNSWQDNFFLVQESKLQTLQMVLNRYLRNAEAMSDATNSAAAAIMQMMQSQQQEVTPETIRMAAIVLAIFPIMLVYPYAQRYFTTGIMLGAVKG